MYSAANPLFIIHIAFVSESVADLVTVVIASGRRSSECQDERGLEISTQTCPVKKGESLRLSV